MDQGLGARTRGKDGLKTLLLGAMMTVSVVAIDIAMAQSAQAQNSAQSVSFSVPAGPLSHALTVFGRQAGLQVTYLASVASGKTSPGFNGTGTRQQALARILQGSGLTYSFPNAMTVAISGPAAGNGATATVDGAIALDTIDVSGGGDGAAPADLPYQTPGSSAYISAQQIERFGGGTAGDIFKSTPGVIAAGNHSGGAAVDVNIRGMQGQNRVKVAIDGTQQTTTTWRGYIGVDERVYLDPDLIGGISIEKGPTGGAEGAGTTGGVVAIRTLNARDILGEGKQQGVRVRIGTSDNAISPAAPATYDQRTSAPSFLDFANGSGSVALASTSENIDLVAAVTRRKTGNYFAGKHGKTHYRFDYSAATQEFPLSFTKPGEEVFNTSEDSFSGLLKGTVRWGEGHSLELGYVHFESRFGESMGSLLFQQDDGFRQVKLADISTNTYTARYRWNPDNDLFDLRMNVWAAKVAGTTRAVSAAPDLSQWGYIPADEPRFSETMTYGVDLSNTSRFDTGLGQFSVNYGLSYLREDMDGKEYCSRIFTRDICVQMLPSVGTRTIGSAFSRGEWKISEWLKVDAGLRYDAFELTDKSARAVPGESARDGGRLNPSVAVTLTPFEGLQVFAQYAEGVRPPTLRETMGSDANSIPNPNLDPEVAKNWEFGANYMRNGLVTANDKVRLKASYFINNYENYISRVPSRAGGGQPAFTFSNLASAMFSGVELSAAYDAGVFFSEAALTYYTDFEFCRTSSTCGPNTVQTDYAANHLPPEVSTSLTVGFRLFDEKLTIGGRAIHNGHRLTPPAGSDRQRTAMWLPYTVFDTFASYKLTDQLTLDLKVQNLTDRYYIDALDGWAPAPGRTIRASLTANF